MQHHLRQMYQLHELSNEHLYEHNRLLKLLPIGSNMQQWCVGADVDGPSNWQVLRVRQLMLPSNLICSKCLVSYIDDPTQQPIRAP